MRQLWSPIVSTLLFAPCSGFAHAQENPAPEFPEFTEVAKDFEAVPAPDGSYYSLWHRKKDGQMLAELPAGYDSHKQFFALTMPSGELFAGLQLGERYVYWKRYDKRLALIEPNVTTRSTGDVESQDGVRRHFTDNVLLDVAIVCMGKNGQPVIDLDELLVGNLGVFYGTGSARANLATVVKAKAFPKNIEIAFEVPDGGTLKTFHYSISQVPESSDYQPRTADPRVGYFTTSYRDLGKTRIDEVWQRRINRWHLEKADKALKLSPPKQPIVFYLEHTVPVRYRRFVKEGVLAWNKAFEGVGIADAIEVQYQDKATGAHMEKDPEDVRYNFIRWLNNDVGLAIGPSRAHPETGQILDADVVLTDGWIRHFWHLSNEFLPQSAIEGMPAETLRWLDARPTWDPRVRLASAPARQRLIDSARRRTMLGEDAYARLSGDANLLTRPDLQEFAARVPHSARLCMAADAKGRNMSMARMALQAVGLLPDTTADDPTVDAIDGIPEWLLGPLLADLVAHEVGHTLGLRHNFKASSIHDLASINSPAFKGKQPLAGSVMDYLPLNVVLDDKGQLVGDVCMVGIGPYDMWAIEYGYTFDDPSKVLSRVAEPHLAFGTDEDADGPDPSVRRYDFAAEPLAFAQSRMQLVAKLRGLLLEKFVKTGESWAKARRGYLVTLEAQLSALSMMADWLGGSFLNRDHKGDPGARKPIAPVPAERQRAALRFVLDNSLRDEVFGLTPDLLGYLTVERWSEDGSAWLEPTYAVHDEVGGVQASVLTMLLNPTTLRRIYDNELAVAADVDVLTLPELLDTVTHEVWTEIGIADASGKSGSTGRVSSDRQYTARSSAVSSLRRNLQREHLERLIDFSLQAGDSSAERAIALLARSSLARIGAALDAIGSPATLDRYTSSHFDDAKARIRQALEATYTYNGGGGNSVYYFQLGRPTDAKK